MITKNFLCKCQNMPKYVISGNSINYIPRKTVYSTSDVNVLRKQYATTRPPPIRPTGANPTAGTGATKAKTARSAEKPRGFLNMFRKSKKAVAPKVGTTPNLVTKTKTNEAILPHGVATTATASKPPTPAPSGATPQKVFNMLQNKLGSASSRVSSAASAPASAPAPAATTASAPAPVGSVQRKVFNLLRNSTGIAANPPPKATQNFQSQLTHPSETLSTATEVSDNFGQDDTKAIHSLREFFMHPLTWEKNNGYFNILLGLSIFGYLFCSACQPTRPTGITPPTQTMD